MKEISTVLVVVSLIFLCIVALGQKCLRRIGIFEKTKIIAWYSFGMSLAIYLFTVVQI